MCGIVGYAGSQPATPILLQGLRDLEYRGYDSSGIAVLEEGPAGARFSITKREGKIARLEGALAATQPSAGTVGIGHTRWATHGQPSDRNAHPHESGAGDVVVVHNGIVENYASLRDELLRQGCAFASDTDTETIAHLLHLHLERGFGLLDALRLTCARLEGSQAIVAMATREPGTLVAARAGNAGGVVVGFGDREHFLASDLAAVIPHTRTVAFLADGQFAEVSATGVRAVDRAGKGVEFEVRNVPLDPVAALKGGHPHFMLKEILEQPSSLADTVQSLLTVEPPAVHLRDLEYALPLLSQVRRVVLIGMGTSLHAAMIGKAYIESIAGIPAESDNASEFRYRPQLNGPETLVVSVSQSGETVDVLEAMAAARSAGAPLVTVCNIEGAQSTRVADGVVYIRAGLERGVASTKCFTGSIAALYALALGLGRLRGVIDDADLVRRLDAFVRLSQAVALQVAAPEALRPLAHRLAPFEDMLFLGRGLGYPTAMEGALKMKEVSYIHAEAYAAGEMKHGPISLIEPSFPTIAVATRHALRSKMISNIEQVQARGGPVFAIVTEGDAEIRRLVTDVIEVPAVAPEFEPVVATIPLQLLAYYVALERGCDVDQPRNLAKTVTVE